MYMCYVALSVTIQLNFLYVLHTSTQIVSYLVPVNPTARGGPFFIPHTDRPYTTPHHSFSYSETISNYFKPKQPSPSDENYFF